MILTHKKFNVVKMKQLMVILLMVNNVVLNPKHGDRLFMFQNIHLFIAGLHFTLLFAPF